MLGSMLLAAACSKVDEGRIERSDVDSVTHVEPRANVAADSHPHSAEGKGRALLPIMQELGVRMAALTHGLMVDSAELVADNAKLMAEHAPIAADELARLQRTLGADMAEFERIDTETHGKLVRLRDAAASGASNDVLTRLNEVQRGCVECHSRFRNRLRTGHAASSAR
jgi:cytochrome c556